MSRLFLISVLALTACGDKSTDGADDSGSTSTGVDIGCDAWFNFAEAEGTEQSFGDCARYGVEGGFEENPDETPTMREISYIFRGGATASGDCWVRWDQTEMCGPGSRRIKVSPTSWILVLAKLAVSGM